MKIPVPVFSFLLCIQAVFSADSLPESLKPEAHQRDPYDWQVRHHQVIERHKEVKPEYVVIGDSIIHKWGGEPSYGMKQDGAESWGRLFGNYTATNMGFGFDYIDNAYFRVREGELAGTSPRVIITLIGTNNIGHRKDSAEATAVNAGALIGLLKKTCPQSKILVLGVLPRTEANLADTIQKANRMIAKYADNKTVFFFDPGKEMMDKKTKLALREYMSDTVHLNKAGYDKVADQLVKVLPKVDKGYKPAAK